MNEMPDLRETTDDDPATVKSHEEFTTVYDIIDQLEAALGEAKSSIFAPGMVKVDRDEFTDQLSELKKMLPVQLERASALMREAERRLESAQTQSNAIVASAQSRAANMIKDANEQAQFLAGQENVTELAWQKARAILDQAQTKADHLTQGADQYCTTVMEGLSQQLGKLSQDVQAGLNVLEERQRAAAQQMPHLTLNDYPEAQYASNATATSVTRITPVTNNSSQHTKGTKNIPWHELKSSPWGHSGSADCFARRSIQAD